jgi:uncharacterized membrane protein
MANHETSIAVNVPLMTAYEEWTDYEAYPRFMEDVREVRVLGDGRIRWRAELGSRTREWEAEVVEDREGGRVAWWSVTGARYDGDVTLSATDDSATTLRLRIEYDPEGVIEGVAGAAKTVRSHVEQAARAFKRYAEERHAGRREAAR